MNTVMELCCLMKGPGPCLACKELVMCIAHFDEKDYNQQNYTTHPYRICMKCGAPMCQECYNNRKVSQTCCWKDPEGDRWTVNPWHLK